MRDVITPREAALRTVAVAALGGLAVVELVALPYGLVQGPAVAAVCAAVIAGSPLLMSALARAGAGGGRAVWRAVAALGLVTVTGWVVTRAVAVPGVAEDAGHWTTPVGLVAAVLGAALAVVGLAGAGPSRGLQAVKAAAGALCVGLALAPVAAIVIAAFGPPPAHLHGVGPNSIPSRHVHTTKVDPAAVAARFRPGFGGHSGNYIYANATRAHLPRWALGLALWAVAVAVGATVGSLRQRTVRGPRTARWSARDERRVTVV